MSTGKICERSDFERFLNLYGNEYSNRFKDFKEVAENVSKELSKCLETKNIKHISMSRQKKLKSLREKLYYKIEFPQSVQSEHQIIKAIKDLAGVRVALYFPSDYVTVESEIFKQFDDVELNIHPNLSSLRSSQQIFQGYCSRHYIVNSKESLEPSDNSSINVQVEIQVASLFMHAWAEVERDWVYKPINFQPEYDEVANLDSLNGLVLASEVQLNSLKQKLAERGLLEEPPREIPPEFSGELLRSTDKKLIIIGQNLYGLLVDDPNFEGRLFTNLENKQLEVRIVVADPDSRKAKIDLSYGYPTFLRDLDLSISVLKRYMQRAKELGLQDRLMVGKSEEVERETLFISDLSDDMRNGKISLWYTLLGTRPQDRPEIVIKSHRHSERFKKLVEGYKGLINWGCVRPL